MIAAAMVVTGRNAVHAALFLIINIVSLAILFLLLGAEFVAAIQIVVYAGAIMVLFLYVVMFSGAAATPEGPDRLAWQRRIAVVAGLMLLVLAVKVISHGGLGPVPAGKQVAGSPAVIGEIVFTQYALPFEIASLLLLVAMVGAIALAKEKKE